MPITGDSKNQMTTILPVANTGTIFHSNVNIYDNKKDVNISFLHSSFFSQQAEKKIRKKKPYSSIRIWRSSRVRACESAFLVSKVHKYVKSSTATFHSICKFKRKSSTFMRIGNFLSIIK